jgi:hypothetical protein
VALADFRPAADKLLEGGQHGFLLAVEADDGKERDLPAEFLWVRIGVIAKDDARLLEPTDATESGWVGQAGAVGRFDVGHPPVGCELRPDTAIDCVQDGRVAERAFHSRMIPDAGR